MPLRLFEPEEVGVGHRHQQLALEAPRLVEDRGVEGERPPAVLPQPRHLVLERRRAPVGQAAVELVAARSGSEGGMGLEVALDERPDELVPLRRRRRVHGRQRLPWRLHARSLPQYPYPVMRSVTSPV